MTKGVNYPKGLLEWCDELGVSTVLGRLDALHAEYGDDRYRASPLLRRRAKERRRVRA
jgi:3-hydroxybutyryl-CoA dehydrogenase